MDLRQRPPRRWSESLGGLIWLPRLIDKVRAFQAGTLGAYAYPSALDRSFMRSFHLTPALIERLVRENSSEESLGRAVRALIPMTDEEIDHRTELFRRNYRLAFALLDRDDGYISGIGYPLPDFCKLRSGVGTNAGRVVRLLQPPSDYRHRPCCSPLAVPPPTLNLPPSRPSRPLILAFAWCLLTTTCFGEEPLTLPSTLAQALEAISADRMRADVRTLSSPAFNGRQTGTVGDHASADFVRQRLESLYRRRDKSNSKPHRLRPRVSDRTRCFGSLGERMILRPPSERTICPSSIHHPPT